MALPFTGDPPISALRGVAADPNRPGQRLLPAYAVKLLRYLKIDFGTDKVPKADIDPTLDLLAHIVECLGVLRDVNKVYRAKGSIPSRSVGARAMFGLTAELGNILLDAMTFNPPETMETASQCYSKVGQFVLNVFPEIAAQDTKATGKVLMHHAALKASESMALETIQMVHKAYPAGAATADASGALPLHWATHNPNISSELIDYIISANPKAPMTPDDDGYLPLHWAVNHDAPSLDVVRRLIHAHAGATATPCARGSLPLHWCVARDHPPVEVVHELLVAHADAIRTYSSDGCLPMHKCVDRPKPSVEVLRMLSDAYPQALQCPDKDGHLPLHRACDHPNPSFVVLKLLLTAFPKAASVQDDDGYTPLHIVLEHDDPSLRVIELLLLAYPDAVSKTTRDGLLPLHCYVANPGLELNLDIAEMLVKGYPQGIHQLATDIVPEDETADPEAWNGQWLERKWSPYTRVVERHMREFQTLFKNFSKGQTPVPVPRDSYLPSLQQGNYGYSSYNKPSNSTGLRTGERAFESSVASEGALPRMRGASGGAQASGGGVFQGRIQDPSPRESARSNATPRSARSRGSRSSRGSDRGDLGPGSARGAGPKDRYDTANVARTSMGQGGNAYEEVDGMVGIDDAAPFNSNQQGSSPKALYNPEDSAGSEEGGRARLPDTLPRENDDDFSDDESVDSRRRRRRDRDRDRDRRGGSRRDSSRDRGDRDRDRDRDRRRDRKDGRSSRGDRDRDRDRDRGDRDGRRRDKRDKDRRKDSVPVELTEEQKEQQRLREEEERIASLPEFTGQGVGGKHDLERIKSRRGVQDDGDLAIDVGTLEIGDSNV